MDPAVILGNHLDKTLLPPLHQKRILVFINHFLISSCGFLNEFAVKCESKFIHLERKLQKVETALLILEAKLESIPNLKNPTDLQSGQKSNEVQLNVDEKIYLKTEETGIKVCEHEVYRKFFKMLNVGVPAQAVRLKMQAEGIDSNLLDNPNKIIPNDQAISNKNIV